MQEVIAQTPDIEITDRLMVPARTLDHVIEHYCGGRCPDLLSIDVEGLDLEILEAASFRSRPKILCVETYSALGKFEPTVDDLLVDRGFRKCVQMFANAVSVERDMRL